MFLSGGIIIDLDCEQILDFILMWRLHQDSWHVGAIEQEVNTFLRLKIWLFTLTYLGTDLHFKHHDPRINRILLSKTNSTIHYKHCVYYKHCRKRAGFSLWWPKAKRKLVATFPANKFKCASQQEELIGCKSICCCCCSVAMLCPIPQGPMDHRTPGHPLLHCLEKISQVNCLYCMLVTYKPGIPTWQL